MWHHSTNQEFLEAVAASTPDGWDVVLDGAGADFTSYFTWEPCELCRSALGGDRHPAAFIKAATKEEPIELEVCTDCLMFIANGDLPHDENPN